LNAPFLLTGGLQVAAIPSPEKALSTVINHSKLRKPNDRQATLLANPSALSTGKAGTSWNCRYWAKGRQHHPPTFSQGI